MKLTNANIARAQSGQTLRDTVVKGLQLRVTPTKRAYYLYYRTQAHIERRPKLGEYPTLSIAQARTVARGWLAKVALGEDPSEKRARERTAPNVNALIARFTETHLPRRRAQTQRSYTRLLETRIRPALGTLRVAKVTHAEIEELHTRIGRTAPVEANRTLSVLSKLFALAEKWGYRTPNTNPCQHIERFKETPRRRYMTQDEAKAVALALKELRETRRYAVDFILLLALTGARKGELAAARWEHYHGDRLELPEALVKNEARTIFLSPPAQAILEELPRLNGTILRIKDPQAAWQALRKMTGIEDLRIHDLRHTYATVLLNQGYGLEQIGQLLGHTQAQTTKRYAHLMRGNASEAAGRAGAQLLEWLAA